LAGWAKLFKTGQWTSGVETVKFEASFAKLCQSPYGVAVNSGTMSLWATLKALGFSKDDEVITTPMTFSATADAIALVGARPVFADVDKITGNLDPVKVAEKITPKTKAILVVHLYGVPVDVHEFVKLAKRHNLILLEDASHAHGATVAGKSVGSFGLAGCFSLYPSKTLGALGNAGIVVTKSKTLAEKIRRTAHHGIVANYKHKTIGLNGLIDNLQAVVLNLKLAFLDQWLAKKRSIAKAYDLALQKVGETGMVVPEDCQAGYYTYAIRVKQRSKFRAWCLDHKVETKIYYPIPLHLQPSYKWLGYKSGDLPVAEWFARHTVSLPLFPEMTQSQINKVITVIAGFFSLGLQKKSS
jgi:dTDP-4-amino-4,6-dideoxygalactose transaminase